MSEKDEPSGRQISNIVFDFGGVLLNWDPRLALEGFYPDGVIDMVLDRRDEWGFWRFNDLCDSGWSQEKILADYESDHGPAVAWVLRTYFDHLDRSLTSVIPGMDQLVRELSAAGLHLWGLTNASRESVDAGLEKFEILRLMEGIVVSADECLRKPDPLIYQVMLRRFRITAEQTLFIDDRPENVRAAQALGIHSLLFTGADQIKRDLRQLGIEC
ncbi:haloacid dehalogenase [Bombiscardovia nodaiensis]|uniref:Haloacid dehalogenase n=1 Tax=Bombiscardovia nodaiensis TaxID=2932181 RepID=A0ABN6S8N5_9BIFI|nr:haloacid dehalogenase [Bombiscardovia nodaiensis]